jgi:hypothetical protein
MISTIKEDEDHLQDDKTLWIIRFKVSLHKSNDKEEDLGTTESSLDY